MSKILVGKSFDDRNANWLSLVELCFDLVLLDDEHSGILAHLRFFSLDYRVQDRVQVIAAHVVGKTVSVFESSPAELAL